MSPGAGRPSTAFSIGARVRGLRIAVALAFLAGLALSPQLWLADGRDYPLVPVAGFLPTVGRPLDALWLLGLAAALVAVAATRRARWPLLGAIALAVGLALLDQSRWQPWAYQYVLMLVALATASPGPSVSPTARQDRDTQALALCGFVVAATYLWSGLSKVGAAFFHEVYPELLDPLVGPAIPPALAATAYAVPVVEAGIGLGLLSSRLRPYAVVGAVLMHVFILLSIGPLGSNRNTVVWPWNLAMATSVLLIFWNPPKELRVASTLRRASSPPVRAVAVTLVVLLGLLPALSFVGRWDSYLSAALYSGANLRGTVFASTTAASVLPASARRELEPTSAGLALPLYSWSMAELNVPPYPARRVLRGVALKLCSSPAVRAGLVLIVAERPDRLSGRRSFTRHRCQDLRRASSGPPRRRIAGAGGGEGGGRGGRAATAPT